MYGKDALTGAKSLMDCSGLISKPLVNKVCLYSPFSSRRDLYPEDRTVSESKSESKGVQTSVFIRTHSAKFPVQKKLPWLWRTRELGEHAAKMYLAVFCLFHLTVFRVQMTHNRWHPYKNGTFWNKDSLYMQAELSETSEFTKCRIPVDFVTLVPVFPSLFFFFK